MGIRKFVLDEYDLKNIVKMYFQIQGIELHEIKVKYDYGYSINDSLPNKDFEGLECRAICPNEVIDKIWKGLRNAENEI